MLALANSHSDVISFLAVVGDVALQDPRRPGKAHRKLLLAGGGDKIATIWSLEQIEDSLEPSNVQLTAPS